ncbi:hypothetical protein DESPIGER_2106 [Desulfovibrio piger]|uniref:Uncharacterized protein n=1 Tax=Desulfovibrio piger TaxID=901 RepID=A0A1K1LGV6_9BACT|nr:hypothetical protein DESPIGER_2106 [Desulfovibrio piger]
MPAAAQPSAALRNRGAKRSYTRQGALCQVRRQSKKGAAPPSGMPRR